MLSHISFILAFALVASGSRVIQGNWRYEGQFVVGNPKLNWDQAGWKLVVPNTIIKPVAGEPGNLIIGFQDPLIRTLNDRLPERTAWSQMDSMDWIQTVTKNIQKPFIVRFENNTVKEIVLEKNDIKESADIKMSFAKHLVKVLHANVRDSGSHVMGKCATEVKTVKNIDNKTVISIIGYHACEHFSGRTIGVIPLKQACLNCEDPKLNLPLGSYTKLEVVRTNSTIVSILSQNVVALPVYQIDSPAYSIYGNTSLIRVSADVPQITPMVINEQRIVSAKNVESSTKEIKGLNKLTVKIIQRAVKLIRAVLSVEGKARQGENILALYDLLTLHPEILRHLPALLKDPVERRVFFSFLVTQESHIALEILMQAILDGAIPVAAVPAIMIPAAKLTDMTDHDLLHKFIKHMEKICPLNNVVSSLAMATIMRRNMKNPTSAIWMLSNETRLRLAMAGNAGINIKMNIAPSDVKLKLAYILSKRSVAKIHHQEVLEELIEILESNKEATVVRAEAFKLIMTLTCDKATWSTVFARLNQIDEPSLISYIVSYLKSFASNKLPINSFLVLQVQQQLPLLKARLQETLLAKHVTLSAYNRKANMGVAVMAEYVIPQINKSNHMKASVEIQSYVLNTLLSIAKVQVVLPVKEIKSTIQYVSQMELTQLKNTKVLSKVAEKLLAVVEKSELSIFNDDMEIVYVSAQQKIGEALKKIVSNITWTGSVRVQGVMVPVVLKKQINTFVGPQVELSLVSYLAVDTIVESFSMKSLSVLPRLVAGTRIKIQADDRITINTGILLKAEVEAGNITTICEREPLGARVETVVPLTIKPVATLQIIPTTGSLIGTPQKDWEQQTSASPRVKTIPISLVAGLAEPAVVLNISGKIQKPLNKHWLTALQEPQIVQVYLLPTYQLPTTQLVIEWIHSRKECLPMKNCLLAEDQSIKNLKWCQRLCVNSVSEEKNQVLRGSTLTVSQRDSLEALRVVVDSRIRLWNESQAGKFVAEAVLTLPSAILPKQLLNKTYLNELKQHKFNTLALMQMTANETEITTQLKKVLSGVTLPESRQEDYTDMNSDILDLYPTLYLNDTVKIPKLHAIFSKLLDLSSKAIAAKSQIYLPNWQNVSALRGAIIDLLKTPLKKDLPEIVEMQDHLTLWCVMKYFELVDLYYHACGKCQIGLTYIQEFKTKVFVQWIEFDEKSRPVVIEVLKASAQGQLDALIDNIISTNQILIKLVKATDINAIKPLYSQLTKSLGMLTLKMHLMTFQQQMVSKIVMKKLVASELLKSMADHWHLGSELAENEEIKKKTATSDLGVSFVSVAGRFIIQACNLLAEKSNAYVHYDLHKLVSQAITVVDYKRWLRSVVIENADIATLKEVVNKLLKLTRESIEILKRLPPTVTEDPMLRIFLTEVMAVLRITIVELQSVPQYARYPTVQIPVEDFEWDLIVLLKNVLGISRPLSTLKRGIMKESEDQYQLRSSGRSLKPEQQVKLTATVQWPTFKLNTTIVAKKSDSQIMHELQQCTLTKSKNMAAILTSLLYGKTILTNPLTWELNVYRDITAMVAAEGKLPQWAKTALAIADEKVKVALLPFAVSLTEEDLQVVPVECQTDRCVRAVISRDSRKVDILCRQPTESNLLLQVPTGL